MRAERVHSSDSPSLGFITWEDVKAGTQAANHITPIAEETEQRRLCQPPRSQLAFPSLIQFKSLPREWCYPQRSGLPMSISNQDDSHRHAHKRSACTGGLLTPGESRLLPVDSSNQRAHSAYIKEIPCAWGLRFQHSSLWATRACFGSAIAAECEARSLWSRESNEAVSLDSLTVNYF